MVGWYRAIRNVVIAALSISLSACIPITLKTEKVEPRVSVAEAAPDWNGQIGPDVRLKLVSDVRRAILAKRKDVEFVEPDVLWAEAFQGAQPGSLQESAALIESLKSGAAADLGLRYLIVVGPEDVVKRDSAFDTVLYSSQLQRMSLKALVLRLGDVELKPRLVQAAAQGMEREGWFPGTPLIFVRFYKEVDTYGGAVRGLASAVLDEISADSADGSPRLVILAEAEESSAPEDPKPTGATP